MLAFFASRGFTQVGTARCRGLDFFAENTRLQANLIGPVARDTKNALTPP
jgi:hypothetical protein